MTGMGNSDWDGKATAMTAYLHRASIFIILHYLYQAIVFLLQDFRMADRVKEVAVEEVDKIKTQTIQAARSAAYLYPLRACYFPPCWHIAYLQYYH